MGSYGAGLGGTSGRLIAPLIQRLVNVVGAAPTEQNPERDCSGHRTAVKAAAIQNEMQWGQVSN